MVIWGEGWIESKKTKNDIHKICQNALQSIQSKSVVADRHYICLVRIDGWCYCFNVIDTFSRKWIWHSFDVAAPKNIAIDSVVNAVATAKLGCSKLILRTDNGSQYNSRDFRQAVTQLGIKHEFIWHHTHQNKTAMSNHFHKTLKKENTSGHTSLQTIRKLKLF